jgi:hypothetical protein
VLTVNAQPVSIFRAQRIRLRQYRTFIDMHQFDRHRRQIAEFIFGV